MFNYVVDLEILDIPYEDALEAAKDIVNLIYKNREYCQVDKVVTDLTNLCNEDECFEDLDIWENIKNNVFPIFSKVEAVIEYLFKADSLSDADILEMVDQIGESYGTIMAIIIGFDKRFTTVKKFIWWIYPKFIEAVQATNPYNSN